MECEKGMRHDFSRINRKKVLIIGSICIAIICIIFYNYLGKTTTQKQSKDNVKPEVTVYTAEHKDMLRRISLFGQTVSEAHIELAAKYSGRIVSVNVKLGDQVKAGDVLLVQDTGDLDLSIRQSQAVVRQAEADVMESESTYEALYSKVNSTYELKKQNYERYASLYEQGAISKEALDTVYQNMVDSKSALDTLVNQSMSDEVPASVESKRAARDKAERSTAMLDKQRDDLILRAPRDGIIGYRAAEVGSIAQAGQKVLELVDNSKIYVDCQVSEQDIAAIKLGTTVDLKVESLGQNFKGKIIYISPAVSTGTKSYIVRIELNSADPLIKAGMFARTQIEVLQRASTIAIPKESIVEKNGKTSIFVIDADQKAEERQVKLGLRNDKEVEIVDGLNDGEIVATSNLARLKTGTKVNTAGDIS